MKHYRKPYNKRKPFGRKSKTTAPYMMGGSKRNEIIGPLTGSHNPKWLAAYLALIFSPIRKVKK